MCCLLTWTGCSGQHAEKEHGSQRWYRSAAPHQTLPITPSTSTFWMLQKNLAVTARLSVFPPRTAFTSLAPTLASSRRSLRPASPRWRLSTVMRKQVQCENSTCAKQLEGTHQACEQLFRNVVFNLCWKGLRDRVAKSIEDSQQLLSSGPMVQSKCQSDLFWSCGTTITCTKLMLCASEETLRCWSRSVSTFFVQLIPLSAPSVPCTTRAKKLHRAVGIDFSTDCPVIILMFIEKLRPLMIPLRYVGTLCSCAEAKSYQPVDPCHQCRAGHGRCHQYPHHWKQHDSWCHSLTQWTSMSTAPARL